jgi:hypothetical protein
MVGLAHHSSPGRRPPAIRPGSTIVSNPDEELTPMPGNAQPETLVSPSVASELSGCPLEQVRTWIASGRLPVRKVNRGQRFVCLETLDALWAAEQAEEIDAMKKPKRKARKA